MIRHDPDPRGTSDNASPDVASGLAARAAALAAPVAKATETPDDLHLRARLGALTVAVPLNKLRHVAPTGPLSTVPEAAPSIRGVTALHGALVPVADLATLLQVPASEEGAVPSWILVVHDGDHGLGLLVDRVEGLEAIAGSQRPRYRSDGSLEGLVRGTSADGSLVLDLDALLTDEHLGPTPVHPTFEGTP